MYNNTCLYIYSNM